MPKESVESFIFTDDGVFPNNSIPLLIFRKVFKPSPDIHPASIEKIFYKNNWVNAWRNGLYSFHHYHSTAHEVLGLYSGWVNAQFGGPDGKIVTATAGDTIVIPAGVAHKNIEQSSDFKVVGAYPVDQIPDMRYGKKAERPITDENIHKVTIPLYDPVYGDKGPLVQMWY